MTTIIFSDTHLTDVFDIHLFEALQKVCSEADQIVINGDFWDGFITNFNAFVTSEWRVLFPLLKKKNAVYVYGNHDPDWMSDERVSQFSVKQVEEYEIVAGDFIYYIRHGHQFYQSNITKLSYILPIFFSRGFLRFIKKQEELGTRLGKLAEWFALGDDIKGDKILQRYVASLPDDNKRNVFGHTHIQRKSKDSKYLNPGEFTVSTQQFIKIDDLTGEVSFNS